MELQYENALEEYNLTVADLSEHAKIGIENINSVLKGVNMLQKSGKQVSDKTISKIEAMDKWVYYEILDQVKGSEDNVDELPYEDDEVLEEAELYAEQQEDEEEEEEEEGSEDELYKKYLETDEEYFEESLEEKEVVKPTNEVQNDTRGALIDKELEVAYKNGKTTITLEELKAISKTAHNVIFTNYEESGDNGIETSYYTLIETDDEVFTLTKK
jgi:hypothetical protein